MDLSQVLGGLPPNDDPRVLADYHGASDAGVYLLDGPEGQDALVQSVDFFTPIVDDPYIYGAAAAANALSDLYAMGATPITALAVVGFPKKGLDLAILAEMLRGGHEKLHEAGAVLLGGHTVQDDEIKLGYAVTGRVGREALVTNRAAREGDRLYLTKPIGTGVLATALKKKKLGEDANLALHRNLVSLNRAASEAMLAVGIASATDVTGFGLLGHAAEMARGSNAALEVEALSVPILPDALRLQAKGYVTGGLETNRRYVEDVLHIEGVVDGNLVDLFLDPQTSGGLLIAVAEGKESRFRQALTERQAAAARIGRVVGQGSARIVLR
jgi:selenide,water dikinase